MTRPNPAPGVTRRDLLNGLALATGLGQAGATHAANAGTGLQGQTDALAAPAHAWRDPPDRHRGVAERDPEVEDLVVVGAGLSGLTGAWWYRQHAGRPVRLLLLDALDEPGGHARRNEFTRADGQRLIGYGGSQSLDSPGLFSPAMRAVLDGLGLDLRRFEQGAYDEGWAGRHGVAGRLMHFDARDWGRSATVAHPAGALPADWVPATPLAPAARADLLRLLTAPAAPATGLHHPAALRSWLSGQTYRHFLARHWRVHPQVQTLYQRATCAYFGVGTDATTALDAHAAGLPGFQGLALGPGLDARLSPSGRQLAAGTDRYIYHYPDGNATVARALLRALVPAALPGTGLDALVDADLRHDALDVADAPVRLRLRSTVVGLRHLGPPERADRVELRYLDGAGRLRTVHARQVLLACWHRVIARLTDELPAAQRAALNDQVKVPLVYATVLLSNWRAWQRAGVQRIDSAAGFWDQCELDFPVSLGGVKFPGHPDQPMLLHLGKVVVPGNGAPARQQAAHGRRELLGWTFEHLEAEIHRLLGGALGRWGLDPARDIEAITVNRWSHGYSYEYMRPWDRFWPGGPLPCETARRGWGRVAIANSDAGAFAYAQGAIDQATRAVAELLPRARLPAGSPQPGPDPARLGLA